MRTLLEILNLSADFLETKGVKRGRHEALEVISFSLGMRPLDVYVQFDRPLTETELEECRNLLKRRAKGEPIQHIRGSVEFLDCTLKVNKEVLIPRQETEILVDRIAKLLSKEELTDKVLLDLCCGSGCIGIALKQRLPELQVVLSDCSPQALAVAKENAESNGIEVEFCEGDFLSPLEGRQFDYLVCNPPYVSEKEFVDLEREVRDYEPKIALVAENNGLSFYQRLAADLPKRLKPGAKVWLEMGCQQGEAVAELFKESPAKQMQILQDWSGHDRFFFLEFE
jgi:release factor glutamine methyltransferase